MAGATPVELTGDGQVPPPPGYPQEYERHVTLGDGRRVFVRPVVPGDSVAIAEAVRHADPETLYRRFLTERPHITQADLTRLTTLDYVHQFALVAADPRTRRGVAVARYTEVEPGVADVAVVVDPAWRRIGLATALIEMLARAAHDRGVHTFTAYHLADNQPVSALCRLGAGGHSRVRDGIAEYTVDLDAQRPTAIRASGDGS